MDISRDLYELISGNSSLNDKIESTKLFTCALCIFQCKTPDLLATHYYTHGNEILECPDCSLIIADIQTFQIHITDHDNNPEICHPKLYEIKSIGFEDTKDYDSIIDDFNDSVIEMDIEVENEVQTDETNQKLSCDICLKSFKKLKSLEIHLKNHSNESTNHCKYCNTKFLLKTSLKQHLKKHEGGGNLNVCSFCNVPYVNQDDLKIHTRKVHPDLKIPSIKCTVCDKVFKKIVI